MAVGYVDTPHVSSAPFVTTMKICDEGSDPLHDIVKVAISERARHSRWGAYFRTGNAAIKFVQVDRYVETRLRSLLLKRHGALSPLLRESWALSPQGDAGPNHSRTWN